MGGIFYYHFYEGTFSYGQIHGEGILRMKRH